MQAVDGHPPQRANSDSEPSELRRVVDRFVHACFAFGCTGESGPHFMETAGDRDFATVSMRAFGKEEWPFDAMFTCLPLRNGTMIQGNPHIAPFRHMIVPAGGEPEEGKVKGMLDAVRAHHRIKETENMNEEYLEALRVRAEGMESSVALMPMPAKEFAKAFLAAMIPIHEEAGMKLVKSYDRDPGADTGAVGRMNRMDFEVEGMDSLFQIMCAATGEDEIRYVSTSTHAGVNDWDVEVQAFTPREVARFALHSMVVLKLGARIMNDVRILPCLDDLADLHHPCDCGDGNGSGQC